ncbi:MAG: hypothetical protein KatS3mg111_3212 [Pirellulaceae bacterium]|nr:MAG: hypothetical protein KatS3mg111_3212 [Pirellulaceae bacterium]
MVHPSDRLQGLLYRGGTPPRRYRRGAALLLAIFVMAVVSALAVAMVDAQTLRFAALRNARDWDQARYLAEAGLQHAFARLEKDYELRQPIGPIEFPAGSDHYYAATIDDGPDGTVVVRAEGTVGEFSRVLVATVKQGG